jgi:putative inorganic carbon (hco3(-)) transporter
MTGSRRRGETRELMFADIQAGGPYPARMLDSEGATTRATRVTPGVWLLGALPLVYVFVAPNMAGLMPIVPGLFTAWYDQQRILEIVLLGAVPVVLAVSSPARRSWIDAFLSVPLLGRALIGGFFVLGAVSAARAAIPSAAFREVSLYLLLVFLALGVTAVRRQVGDRFDRIVVIVLVFTAVIYTFAFIGLRLAGIPPFQYMLSTYGAMYGFSNPRFFGQFAVLTLPVLLAAPLVTEERRLTKGILFAAAAGWFALTIESGGRAPIAAVPVGLMAVLALLRRVSFPWARVAAIGMAAGAAMWFVAVQTASALRGEGLGLTPAVQEAIDRGPVDRIYRPVFWREAWEMLQSRPVLGVGPEHFAYHRVESTAAGVHNAPLQLGAEWGVLAAVLMLAATLWGVLAWTRRTYSLGTAGHDVVLRTALLATVIAAGALSLLDGIIVTPVSQLVIALVAGWMVGIHTASGLHRPSEASQPPPRPVGPWQYSVPAVALVAAAVLVWTASPYLFRPRAELEVRIDRVTDTGDRVLYPRFWVEGRLPEY